MRLLSKPDQEKIILQLQTIIQKMGVGITANNTYIEVISGRDEGVFLWVAMNYALGRFDPSKFLIVESTTHDTNKWLEEGHILIQYHRINGETVEKEVYLCVGKAKESNKLICRPSTVGILDMGGASMQIAFEFDTPNFVCIIHFAKL